jgi:hypothetical protein
MTPLPKPTCKYGYTSRDISRIFDLGVDAEHFWRWMRGQTMMLCDGTRYDPDVAWTDSRGVKYQGRYELDCPVAHGGIVYVHDVALYLSGGDCVD